MPKVSSLLPLGAVLLSVSLLAQQAEPPPPPRTPATPPANPSTAETPKVNIPPAAPSPSAPAPSRPAPAPAPDSQPVKSRVKGTPVPVATPLPVGTPRPGFWERVFGRRKRVAPTPRPTVSTTPKPTKSGTRPKSETPEKPTTPAPKKERPAKPEKPETERPKATPEPEKPKSASEPKTAPEPKATPEPKPPKQPKSTAKATPAPSADDGADAEVVERNKFNEAKRRAAEDPEVTALKEKADSAANEEDARKALRAYNKALFQKMRKLDGSIKDRIDATEAAIMRRLDE